MFYAVGISGPLPKEIVSSLTSCQIAVHQTADVDLNQSQNHKSSHGGTTKVMVHERTWTGDRDQMLKHLKLWKRQRTVKRTGTPWECCGILHVLVF